MRILKDIKGLEIYLLKHIPTKISMNENVNVLFQSLASLEEKINPGQLESDKDQLLLINEKEKLLRELRSLLSQNKGTKLKELKTKCSRLEQDLNEAQEMTNRCIAGKRKTISYHHW